MELGVTDLGNNKRRILLSTSQKEIQVTPLHAKVPMTIVKRAVWLNLAIDMVSLVGEMWVGQTFRSVDQISISANCKLKRVFTMKSQPPDTTEDEELEGFLTVTSGEIDNIPKQCQMASDVIQITQVLTLSKIKAADRIRSGKGLGLADQFRPGSMLDLDLNASGRKVQTSDGKIAFGSKAPRAPDTGRKTGRQGSVTNRSFKSQNSRTESKPAVLIFMKTINSEILISFSFNGVLSLHSGLKEKQLVAPHPPREPSSDRVRRKPRIKPLGQNGVSNRGKTVLLFHNDVNGLIAGDSNFVSPPTSATQSGQMGSRAQVGHQSVLSPNAARIRERLGEVREVKVSRSLMRDSGVGPDVPEIQSPRKGKIRNLRNEEMETFQEDRFKEGDRAQRRKDAESNIKQSLEDDESNRSTSASESSHPGEYEESDEETSGDNKLHLFVSPPKSASLRRNISPSALDPETSQSKKSISKSLRSNGKKSTDTNSYRGARLEDDFVSHSSSEDDPLSIRHNGYDSNNYVTLASNPKPRAHSGGIRSRPMPKNSASPDQKPIFDPKAYSEKRDRDSVTRMSKKSLREITNPKNEGNEPYEATKYMLAEVTESFETRMYESMRRQGEEVLQRVSPTPNYGLVPQTLRNSQLYQTPSEQGQTTHQYSESPATTSDDDTSFSTWKAPALNQAPHNYQDEMKSRRSSDTLTSSNPRDWSGVMSPPIGPLSHVQDLQGTMEGISDDLSDDAHHGECIMCLSVVTHGKKSAEDDDKLDVYFDPKLNCYYDPKSNKYYELVS
ncbi:unnamed protein product [Lymnaea stagnalis]|uniref:CFA20 domain-containing protein n=1 Tax=Lymnaea stagnalis TaxID=6523 RepID=A0AAV2GYZ1_LYMST